jgi:predicted tellurium resistance membrane protein TerC
MHGNRLIAERGGTGQLRAFAATVGRNPTIAMLALGFLLLTGAALIAGGFGFHFAKGYIYAAMAFSGAFEGLLARCTRKQPPK